MRLILNLALVIGTCSAITPVFAGTPYMKVLNNQAIRGALTGNLISYSPAGWLDAGIHEEFHKNGLWRGTYYSRGPVRFDGQWAIKAGRLCVSPSSGTFVTRWFSGDRCRAVWRDRAGHLFSEHLNPRPYGSDLLPLMVKSLKAFGYVR